MNSSDRIRSEKLLGPNIPAWETFEKDYGKLVSDVARLVDQLDPGDEKTLHFFLAALGRIGVQQNEIAEWLGVERINVNRWMLGKGIPRYPDFRKNCVEKLRKRMDEWMKRPWPIDEE